MQRASSSSSSLAWVFRLVSSGAVLSFAMDAAAVETPEYSPLPPPAAPVADPSVRPVAPLAGSRPKAAAAPPATTAVAPNALTTTTTSASLPPPAPPAPNGAAGVGGVGAASSAPADPDAPSSGSGRHTSTLDDDRFSIAPYAGFATNNLNLGIGVRAGATVIPHLWLGGTFVYHTGNSTAGAINGVQYSASASAFYVGPEAGYDFELGPVLLRPYAGIGIGGFSTSATNGNVTVGDTATKLLVWPGVTVLYGLPGARFFVGGDTRLISVPGGPAFAAYGVGGITL
jgi:hypothetical protein